MGSVLLLLVGLVSSPPAPTDSLQSAAAVALAAVEGDSIDSVRRRFEAQLGGPSDAAGQLGLVYLALFTYDFARAESRFRSVGEASTPRALAADSHTEKFISMRCHPRSESARRIRAPRQRAR